MALICPEEIEGKRILISPLNWGWGHVSRCIPVIKDLLGRRNSLVVACTDEQRAVFEEYFSELQFVDHDPYPFYFGGKGHFTFDMLRRRKALNARLKREFTETEALVDRWKIDIVLSDHRYGFRSRRVPSFFLTHQVNLPVRFGEGWVQSLHHKLIREFDGLWIFDNEKHSLAGNLSVNTGRFPAFYMGPRSRFEGCSDSERGTGTVVILSGPEVYARMFLQRFAGREDYVFIGPPSLEAEQVRLIHGWRNQDAYICKASRLIAPSGYSTIMDAHFLRVDTELYPTPGQREQEYLYRLHGAK